MSQQASPGEVSPTSTKAPLSRARADTELTYDTVQAIKAQFDGINDGRFVDSPDFSAPPRAPRFTDSAIDTQTRPSKRKASQFSLRSITSTIAAKRPRLGLGKLAATIVKGSTRKVSHVRQKWRQQNELEMQQFEAWRATRRRERPGDPLKGKHEKGYSAFSFDRSRYGNEEWWKEGVAKYQAPSWMAFYR